MRTLLAEQADFFRALEGETPPTGLGGRFEIYRFAYFERIRSSIAEDYPGLFEYLESVSGLSPPVDSDAVTRDLLNWSHPSSWTLAEASLPVQESMDRLLDHPRWAAVRREAIRRIALDDAEGLASWLEEWPEPQGERPTWTSEFAAGRLRIARTKTWREAADRVFWRSDKGVRTAARSDFETFLGLLATSTTPASLAEFSTRIEGREDAAQISEFFRRGVGEGWLRLTP